MRVLLQYADGTSERAICSDSDDLISLLDGFDDFWENRICFPMKIEFNVLIISIPADVATTASEGLTLEDWTE